MTSDPSDLSSLRIDRTSANAPRRGSRWPLLFGIVALAAVAAIAWRMLAPQPREVRVAIAQASGGTAAVGGGISANGYVVARTKASVSAKVAGRLAYLGVAEGSRVRKGEVMARIESADYAAELNAALANAGTYEAQIAQAARDLARAEALRQRDLVADQEVENARTKLEVLQAQLKNARAQTSLAEVNLENTNVRAPFDGTILRKDAEQGEIVAPSSAGGGLTRTAIVTMADLRTLEVEVDVNEAYIAQVTNGQQARITLDAYPDTSFAGTVRQVVPTADRQKATVLVKVAILDRDPRILPEMGAKVEFVRGAGDASVITVRRVTVPQDALVRGAGDAQVWVLSDGDRPTLKRVTVQIGATRGDQIEIRDGLLGGERVVLAPDASLVPGAHVRVAKPK